MANLVAIDLTSERATLVAASVEPASPIRLLEVKTVDKNTRAETVETEEEEGAAPASVNGTPPHNPYPLSSFAPEDIDAALGAFSGRQVLFAGVALPFRDQKRLEQIVPLQIQDLVPFDIDEFVVDTLVTGQKPDGQYEVLTSLAPKDKISEMLARARQTGIEPKSLTSKASAVSALRMLCRDKLQGSFVLLVFDGNSYSLAAFADNRLSHLRELECSGTPEAELALVQDVFLSTRRLEETHPGLMLDLFSIGVSDALLYRAASLGLKFKPIDLTDYVVAEGLDWDTVNRLGWAVGLFANDLHERQAPGRRLGLLSPSDKQIINFRQGSFAFHTAWADILAAFHDELFYIGLALVLVVLWVGTTVYNSSRMLSAVDDAIGESVRQAMPGVAIPYRREINVIDEKIAELEEKLSGLGSLSSLSPLGSLKELSAAVPPSIDISVDAVNINASGLSMRGTVSDNPAIGKLSGALEARKDRFCVVKVDSKGRAGNRVSFTGEIEFCK